MQAMQAGSLLVAMPALTDPNFDRTVVYVVDHGEQGTLGVVLNRPSDTELDDVLPGWSMLAAAPRTFHVGGPCETDTALCLGVGLGLGPGKAAEGVSGVRPVTSSVHLVDLDGDPQTMATVLQRLRVFAGYAGWGSGQLEAEIAAGAWLVLTSRAEDVVSDAGPGLWGRVLRRQGGSIALLSTYPKDPTLN